MSGYWQFRSSLLRVALLAIAGGGLAGLRPGGFVVGAESLDVDESFFADRLYPVFQNRQCPLCHADNGVGSETELEFPTADASREQVIAFGFRLLDVVDRERPEESLLLRKPTNREEHTGGERIKPGSPEEQMLRQWVEHLAGLSDAQVRAARERIAVAERRRLLPLAVRRLTHSQYDHTVRDLLGDESQPAQQFPKEDFIRGFRNQLEGQGISPLQAEAYGVAAERLAASAFRGGDHRRLLPPDDGSAAEERGRRFVREFGARAFRRPLSDEELALYNSLFQSEYQQAGDVVAGARIVVETMLQSPHFLFRVERGEQGPYVPYERASRLAYLLWDTMPDEALTTAAAEGKLATREQVEQLARNMLNDPRAKLAADEFLAQWLRFDRVLSATKDRRRFRNFTPDTAAAMIEETRQLFRHLVWEDRNFLEFFTADYTFVNAELARLYDLPEPAEDFAMVRYPPGSGRSGVLGHGSFLVLTSKPAETSPTSRGLFVRNHFLGHEVPPPPPGANTVLPENTEARPLTNRERLALHLNSDACASCHRLIDPIGLGFEQYNAIGVFQPRMSLQFGGRERTTTHELPLDTTAFIQGMAESEFSTPRELGRILAGSETCQRCIVKQWFRYAFGREETPDDHPVLDGMLQQFRDSGFRFRELMMALVSSDLFLQERSQ